MTTPIGDHLRRIAESTDDLLVLQGLDGRYLYCNAPTRWGIQPGELIGKTAHDIFSDAEAVECDRQNQQVIQSQTPATFEHCITWRGKPHWFSTRVDPVHNAAGRVDAVVRVCRQIDTQKSHERAQQRRQQYLHELFDNAPIGYQSLDADGHILDVNATWLKTLGYELNEVSGRWFGDLLEPGEAARFRDRFEEFKRAGTVRGVEFQLRCANGDWLQVSFDGNIARDSDGRFVRTQCTMYDLTRYRAAQASLTESERRYRELFEHALIGIYCTTPDGQIVSANPALVRMLGFRSFEELAKRNLEHEGFEPSYPRREFRERLEHDGRITGLESAWTCRDGSTIHVREYALLVRDDNGRPLRYEGCVEDITARKLSEQALRESEDRFRVIANYTYDFEIWVDCEGHACWVNPAAKRFTGYGVGECLAMPDFPIPLIHADERDDWRSRLHTALSRRTSENDVPLRLVRKDGSPLPATVSWQPAYDNAGQCVGLRASIRDVSQRLEAEAALRRRDAILEAVSLAAEQFLECSTPDEAHAAVWAKLGAAAEVSRVHVFAIDTDREPIIARQRWEWVAENITPTRDDAGLREFRFDEYGAADWPQRLRSGDVIVGDTHRFPPRQAATLARYDVQSVLSVPVFLGKRWWGLIGFDQCERTRVWSEGEIQALQTAARIFGAALQRQEFAAAREQLVTELRTALEHVKTLHGLLPICSSCKKVRDDHGYWERIDVYIRDHADVEFSHGLCPDCVRSLYPEMADEVQRALDDDQA